MMLLHQGSKRECILHLQGVAVVVMWIASSSVTVTASEPTERPRPMIRQWSGWYNTDNPQTSAIGDDESVESIRERGVDVCKGGEPVNAVCRLANDKSVVFNSRTTSFTENKLHVPCTTSGLVCRNSDQHNDTCKDYEVRFECLEKEDIGQENLGIIGLAAGLSILAPILCVLAMHVARIVKDRREGTDSSNTANNSSTSTNSVHSGDTNDERIRRAMERDLPPSYVDLFGDHDGSTDSLLTRSNSHSSIVIIEERDIYIQRDAHRHMYSPVSNDDDVSDNSFNDSGVYSISGNHVRSTDTPPRASHIYLHSPADDRPRFSPGMHLSIVDISPADYRRSSTCSDMSESSTITQTPPPTYQEAISILRDMALNFQAKESQAFPNLICSDTPRSALEV